MENKKYLNEQTYQKNKNKLIFGSIIVLLIGIIGGGLLIAKGLIIQSEVDLRYSEENIANVEDSLNAEKNILETKRLELTSKGIVYDVFTKYTDGEAYDLKIITEVLNPSFNRCILDEYNQNELTKKYCSLKEELDEISDENNKVFDSQDGIMLYIFGGFIIFVGCMISFVISRFAKGRENLAFYAQQVMPITKEAMEEMAPTMVKLEKEKMESLAPTIGNVAREISKGIKDGIKDDEE